MLETGIVKAAVGIGVQCGSRRIGTLGSEAPGCACGGDTEPLLRSRVDGGERVHAEEDAGAIRDRVVAAVRDLPPLTGP